MEVLIVATITTFVTFALTPLLQKMSRRTSNGLHIHHSVIGVAIFVLGLILSNVIVFSIGLGIYVSHGFEEMYYNKRKFPQAFLIFVTHG